MSHRVRPQRRRSKKRASQREERARHIPNSPRGNRKATRRAKKEQEQRLERLRRELRDRQERLEHQSPDFLLGAHFPFAAVGRWPLDWLRAPWERSRDEPEKVNWKKEGF